MRIEVLGRYFMINPIYDLYGADENGYIINIIKRIPTQGHKNKKWMMCEVRKYGQNGKRKMYAHRFIWECFHGEVLNDKLIYHINKNTCDNRLSNLCLKSKKDFFNNIIIERDYSFVKNNHANRRSIRAINLNTGEVSCFKSMYAVRKDLGINAGIVKMICDKVNNCKTGISRINGDRYTFQYINIPEIQNPIEIQNTP